MFEEWVLFSSLGGEIIALLRPLIELLDTLGGQNSNK
jgi:hypothetical protein